MISLIFQNEFLDHRENSHIAEKQFTLIHVYASNHPQALKHKLIKLNWLGLTLSQG